MAEQLDNRKHNIAPQLQQASPIPQIRQFPVLWVFQLGKAGFHIPHIADHPAAGHAHQPGKAGAVCRLNPLKKHQPPLFRFHKQFPGLILFQHHRFFAEHVLAVGKGRFYVRVMGFMGGSDVYRIHQGIEFFQGLAEFNPPPPGKMQRAFHVGIVNRFHADPADQLGFRDEPPGNPPCADDPDPLDMLILNPQHGAGNIFRPFQVNHLAVILQVIKLSCPVGAYGKDIHLVLFNVPEFLPWRLLDDNLIGKPGFPYIFNPGHQGVHHIKLPPGLVVFFRGDAYDQVVPQRLGPF